MMKPITHLFVCGAVPATGTRICHCDTKAALDILQYLRHEVSEREMHGVIVTGCECTSHCEYGPVVIVYPEGTWYCQVDKQGASEILDTMRNAALFKSVAGCAGCRR